jgi:hypothetical protein
LAIDKLVFRDDGVPTFTEDPGFAGIEYCPYCGAWHEALTLVGVTVFCAFCKTTHHSRSCRAGLGERCSDPRADPIHAFLSRECLKHQKFDLSFCRGCNCFHSKEGWKICLEHNRPKANWRKSQKMIWKLRWKICTSAGENSTLRKERSLFNLDDLVRIVPYEYPFSTGRFQHHCET